jgi:thioredoxin reductase
MATGGIAIVTGGAGGLGQAFVANRRSNTVTLIDAGLVNASRVAAPAVSATTCVAAVSVPERNVSV